MLTPIDGFIADPGGDLRFGSREIPRPIALSQVSSRRFSQGVTVHVYRPEYDSTGSA